MKLIEVIAAHLRQRAISLFPHLDDWLIRDLIRNRLILHTKILLQTVQNLGLKPNLKKSEVDTSTEIHLYRYGISDSTEYSHGTSRPSRTSYSDYQNIFISDSKKGKRKVLGVPQSQTAALPRSQEEEETDKSKQAQTEQTYEKH